MISTHTHARTHTPRRILTQDGNPLTPPPPHPTPSPSLSLPPNQGDALAKEFTTDKDKGKRKALLAQAELLAAGLYVGGWEHFVFVPYVMHDIICVCMLCNT